MDVVAIKDMLVTKLVNILPGIGKALLVLVLGWIFAVIVRAAIRKGLGLIGLNERIRKSADAKMDLEDGIARGGFYVVLLGTLIAVFDALRLQLVSAPLQGLLDKILAFLPNLVAGGVLILVAWLLATLVRKVVTAGLAQTALDDKLSKEAGMRPMSENLGNVLYGLILLLFLPAILGALELGGLLEPVQGMVDDILAMLPNVFGAAILGVVGWFAARIVSNIVTDFLSAAGADKLGQKLGLKGTMNLSRLVGLIIFIFVFVPTLIQAMMTLRIDAISGPATQMLGTFIEAVPNLIAAALILTVAFLLADFISNLVSELLGGLGFDRLPDKLGLAAAFPEGATPSKIVGRLIVFFVVLFAAVEAAELLGFSQVSEVVGVLIDFGGQIVLGVVIIGFGLWISNLAHAAITRVERPNSSAMAALARITILGLVFAMGLRAMGIADDIVNLAFGLTLGAVAVAVALSFGLGGREAAGRQMEHWLARLRGE